MKNKKALYTIIIVTLAAVVFAGVILLANREKGDPDSKTGDTSAENIADPDAGFAEQTPEEINGKDTKDSKDSQGNGKDAQGGEESEAMEESINILSSIKDSLFSGPEASVPPEELRPDNDFAGLFANDAYTALIRKNENGEMQVTIASATADPALSEWTMSGFFSDESYRIRYADAVKSLITFDAGGTETGRETVYENGSGTIRFSDPNHFLWDNDTEPIENNVFQRSRPEE